MKNRGFFVMMFAVALSFAPQFSDTSSAASAKYSAQLISPTNAAVMDVRFGCEPGYPESCAPQPASTFVIAHSTGTH
jgi:hypothetical protein